MKFPKTKIEGEKAIEGRLVTVTSEFNIPPALMFSKLIQVDTLKKIAWPVVNLSLSSDIAIGGVLMKRLILCYGHQIQNIHLMFLEG